ncbi:hypothetical protein DFH11DRAFT_1086330 [Phellopilus nigrolimitatus]|nr:hypothetical protein DFH11DRAFT_1086330 [Phellopilus nigrolimitatus]
MRLIDLPADVLLRVLALCNVEDVLRVEMMCKFLQDIVTTRHLWLTLLRGLPNECAPDLPPHVSIESLDCSSLKSLVVRAVRGNRNWNSPSPKATREIKVIGNNPVRKPALVINKASFVPGGDYLVVKWAIRSAAQDGYLQLLEVSNGEKIWLYPNPDSYTSSTSRKLWAYGVDRIADNVLRVATAETDWKIYTLHRHLRFFRMAIKVFEIDLCERRSKTIYDHQLGNGYLMDPVALYLQGDHIVLVGYTKALYFLNWKSSCFVELKFEDATIEANQLIRGFLFTVHRQVDSFILRVTDVRQALEAVSGQERTSLTIHMNASPAVKEAEHQFNIRNAYTIDMQTFNAFWRQESNIDIYLLAVFPGDQGSSRMVMTYSFTPQTRTFEYKYEAKLELDGDEHYCGMVSSQSGRLVVWGEWGVYGSDVHRINRDGPNDRLCRKVLPDRFHCYGMHPYSGAILWSEKRSSSTEVRISYFD